MVRLIEVKQVRSRLSLPDDSGINAAITSAIDAALPSLRSTLQTEFDAGSSTDLFFIDPEVHRAIAGFYTLKARNGFLKTDSVLFATATSFSDLQSTAPILVPSILLEEKGFVRISDEYSGKYVKLVYDFGFAESDDIPEWLIEVAISYVSKVLSAQQVGDQKTPITEIYKFVDLHGGGILDSRLRVMSEAIRALN